MTKIDQPTIHWILGLSDQVGINRYLSFVPRTEMFRCQIASFIFSDYFSLLGFVYTNETGDHHLLEPGMTIDIGNHAGEFNHGKVRFKSINTSAKAIYIGEVGYPEVPCDVNDWLTIRQEYLIWQKKPRIVPQKINNSEFYNTFIEYHDYDALYVDQNQNIKPKANITRSGKTTQPILADFVTPGANSRVVQLEGVYSEAYAPGATITSYLWDVADGTITMGSPTSASIYVRFPDSTAFRYISLQVTDTNGTTSDKMYLPLWVHNDTNRPIVDFKVASDNESNGRQMDFFIRKEPPVQPIEIPKGAIVCYWEAIDTLHYIRSFLGFNATQSSKQKIHGHGIKLSIKGAQFWLNQISGFAQTLVVSDGTPATWYEIPLGSSVNTVVYYTLKEYTTAMNVCNLFKSDIQSGIAGEDIPKGTIWSQIVHLSKANELSTIFVDSINGIRSFRHYAYLEQTERERVQPLMHIDKTFWTHEGGLNVDESDVQDVGYVFAEGGLMLNLQHPENMKIDSI